MDRNKKHYPPRIPTRLPGVSEVVSLTECTGLMPTPPLNDAEWNAYKQLFSVELPETDVWHRS